MAIKYPTRTPEGDYLFYGKYYEDYPSEEVEKMETLDDMEADRRMQEALDILSEIEVDNG